MQAGLAFLFMLPGSAFFNDDLSVPAISKAFDGRKGQMIPTLLFSSRL